MNYTLHQLQVFLKVVELGSVSKAAEELHLTQPAVSIQLKKFQDEFDLPLTEVIGRRIFITDFGKEMAVSARNILEQVREISYRAEAFRGGLVGRLKLSVVSTGKYVMPYFLSDFMRNHPGVELEMDVTNKSKVLHSLENNEMDFALVSLLPSHLQVEKIDLLRNDLYLVGNQKLPRHAASSPQKLFQELPLIFREQGSGTRLVMERYISSKKLSVQKKLELTSNEAVKQAVMAGLGFSIMPLIGIRNELLSRQLHILPSKGLPISTTWSLIWLKGKRHSPVAKSYIDFLKAAKNEIVEKHFSWYDRYSIEGKSEGM